jgi:hypothetical protein
MENYAFRVAAYDFLIITFLNGIAVGLFCLLSVKLWLVSVVAFGSIVIFITIYINSIFIMHRNKL